MSLIKSLIQRLLDSRTTVAEAAHSASSTYTEPTWFNGTPTVGDSWTNGLYTGTAPTDGYLNVSGTANINAANAGAMVQANIGGAQISQVSPLSGQGFNMMAPISKGATFSVNGIRLSDLTARFFKAIGGGYNYLARRALSCLKPSFNFSLKNSLLAEATGFPTNPIQLFKRRISHLQRQESGFLSSLLATGGSASKGLPRKFCLATGRFGRGAIQQRHLIKAFVFLSQKAGLWPTYYRQTPRAHMSSLFRVSAINSFQTGGALC